jgi:MscS family membrane protein
MPTPAALHLPVALFSLLLAAAVWLGLQLLARRFPRGSLARELLQRARLSLGVTLLLGGLGWWLFTLLERWGVDLPLDSRRLRDGVFTLGVLWTVLRCKATLLGHVATDPRWLPQSNSSDRAFLIDLIDKLVSALALLIGGLAVLRLLGVSATVLLTASGLGAAALGFGARAVVENLLSGVMLYVNRPFGVGELIDLPEQELGGTVRSIGVYYTELITRDLELLYIPNSLFATNPIGNQSRRDHRRLLIELALRPQDPAQLKELTAELAEYLKHCPGVVSDLPRRVHVQTGVDGRMNLRIECFGPNDLDAHHDLRHRLLLAACELVQRHGGRLAP